MQPPAPAGRGPLLTSRRAPSARGQDALVLCLEREGRNVVGRRALPPAPPHPTPARSAGSPLLPTWLRVLCDFCIQARHWSYRRKLRLEQYACFLSQPRNCLSSRRTGPELGSPPRGSHAPPPGPGRSAPGLQRGGGEERPASRHARQGARTGRRGKQGLGGPPPQFPLDASYPVLWALHDSPAAPLLARLRPWGGGKEERGAPLPLPHPPSPAV